MGTERDDSEITMVVERDDEAIESRRMVASIRESAGVRYIEAENEGHGFEHPLNCSTWPPRRWISRRSASSWGECP